MPIRFLHPISLRLSTHLCTSFTKQYISYIRLRTVSGAVTKITVPFPDFLNLSNVHSPHCSAESRSFA